MEQNSQFSNYEHWNVPSFDQDEAPQDREFNEEFEAPQTKSLSNTQNHQNNFDHKKSLLERLEHKKQPRRAFKTDEFVQEDTLLTNVEDYSLKIREDAEHYAKQLREEIELLKSEVEMELANALLLKQEAEQKAQEITQNAIEIAKKAENEAKERGFETGVLEGIQKNQEDTAIHLTNLHKVINEVAVLRETLLQQHESEIVELGMLLAQKILHQELSSNKEMITGILHEILPNFEGLGSVKLRINPAEFDFVNTQKESLSHFLEEGQRLVIKPDPKVPTTAPVIETDFSQVDLALDKQLQIMGDELRNCIQERKFLFQTSSP